MLDRIGEACVGVGLGELESPSTQHSFKVDASQAGYTRTDPTRSQDAAFFKLPIELRNAIYRLIVISPLSRATNWPLYRPTCVDDAIFKTGHFKKNAVVPLLQTCHQIHVEASSILYGENVFLFQYSSLANSPLPFFDLLPGKYLRHMKKAYLLTKYYVPWPLQPTYYSDLGVDAREEDVSFKRRDTILKIEQEGSKMVARRALSPKSGFVVNFHDTVDIPTKRTYGQLPRGLNDVEDDEGWTSSSQLWTLVLIRLPDATYRQEFRRMVWSSTTDHHRQHGKNHDAGRTACKPY
ncbi:MAG: hypothetical protein Q9184_003227 [Pyrenodesmia sp. 2 TL-2023]